jgi:hypothetical protein
MLPPDDGSRPEDMNRLAFVSQLGVRGRGRYAVDASSNRIVFDWSDEDATGINRGDYHFAAPPRHFGGDASLSSSSTLMLRPIGWRGLHSGNDLHFSSTSSSVAKTRTPTATATINISTIALVSRFAGLRRRSSMANFPRLT